MMRKHNVQIIDINDYNEIVSSLVKALEKAVSDYGKPGGPWNVPSQPGTWLAMAQAALAKARGEAMAEIKITPQLLDHLRGLAENCQPPIWELNEHSDVVSAAHTVAEVAYDEDAQFIAAADPATVLALVEEIERLRELLKHAVFQVSNQIFKTESEAGQ